MFQANPANICNIALPDKLIWFSVFRVWQRENTTPQTYFVPLDTVNTANVPMPRAVMTGNHELLLHLHGSSMKGGFGDAYLGFELL